MKKIVVAILTLSVLLVFTGCSSGEVGLYRTARQIQALKDYSFSGDLSVNVQKLEVTALDGETEEETAERTEQVNDLKAQLQGKSLLFSGSVGSSSGKFTLNLSTKAGGDTNTLFNLITEPDSIYVNKSVAEELLPTECQSEAVTIGGVSYAKYDAADLLSTVENAEYADTEPENPYDAEKDEDQYNGYDSGSAYGYSDGYSGEEKEDQYPDQEEDPQSEAFRAAFTEGYDAAYPAGKADAETDASNRALALQQYVPMIKPLLNLQDSSGQDLQKRLNDLFDDVINTFKDSPDLGLVTKSGDHAFQSNLTADAVLPAMETGFEYLSTHTTQLKGVLIRFVNSLSADEFEQMFPDETKSEVLDSINSITADTFTEGSGDEDDTGGEDISGDENDSGDENVSGDEEDPGDEDGSEQDGGGESLTPIETIEQIEEALSMDFDTSRTGVQSTLTKTGVSSYQNTVVGTFATVEDNEFGVNEDVSVTLHFNINSGSEVLPVSILSTSVQKTGATIRLRVTDPNSVETGLYLSTSKTMSGAKRVKAVKSGNDETISLSGLTPGTTYEYQVYSLDNAGNLIRDTTVRSFTTAGASIPNPNTGDSSAAPVYVATLLAAAGCVGLGSRRRRVDAGRRK